jgi:hypothetical protein
LKFVLSNPEYLFSYSIGLSKGHPNSFDGGGVSIALWESNITIGLQDWEEANFGEDNVYYWLSCDI